MNRKLSFPFFYFILL